MNILRIQQLLLMVTLSFLLTLGCSKEDDNGNPAGPGENEALWIKLDADSFEVTIDGLPTTDVDGEQVILLSEFISTDLIPLYESGGASNDTRPLYAYQIEAADGFSASGSRGYENNTWEQMAAGYYVIASGRAVFPPELQLPGAYNVQDVARIVVCRKFDLQLPDSSLFVECRDVSPEEIENHEGVLEQALPLSGFLPLDLIGDPAGMLYNIYAVDDFGPGEAMSWELFQTGYWLLESRRTYFTDPALASGSYRLRALQGIQVSDPGNP